MREETAAIAAKSAVPSGRWTRLRIHARVIAIAFVFGLGAYAVIQALIALTRHLGWLDWLHR